jgi:hypothetical protein
MMLTNLAHLLQTTQIEVAKLLVSTVALVGTAVAAIIAIRTFRRTEQWKRAEFLANEMKEFLDDRNVRNALLLIDWGSRQITLLDENAPNQGKIRVTRQLQVRALLPHTIVHPSVGSDVEQSSEQSESGLLAYSAEEAAIRDCYDAFLDGLERLSNYVQSGLVDGSALKPYIGYWIDDIHAATSDPDDAAWAATLLTYIDFYRFKGVQWLFSHLDRSIGCDSVAYRGFLRSMEDQKLAGLLANVAKIEYPGDLSTSSHQPTIGNPGDDM